MRIFLHSPGHFSPRAFLQRRLPERPPTATKRTLCLTLPSRSPLRVSSPSSSPPMLSSDRLWLLYHRLRFRLRRLWDRFRFFVYETFFGGQSIERMPTELRSFAHLSKGYRYRMTSDDLPSKPQEAKKDGKQSEVPSELLQMFSPAADYKTKAWMLCKEYLTGRWREVDEDEFQIKRVSGGLSNHIFHCSLPKSDRREGAASTSSSSSSSPEMEPTDVLLRLYGGVDDSESSLTSYITSHVIDNVVFTILSERELGPKLYGVFPEGRLEEFIPARAMSLAEVRDPALSAIIARKMARIHSLRVPINKERDWLTKMFDRYRGQIGQLSMSQVDPEYHEVAVELLYFDFDKEIKWLTDFLAQARSPVVFCHNDVQGGNVLLHQDTGRKQEERVMLIDYEFCGYNYRGYDLANHLCEWTYDYSEKSFPYYRRRRENFPSKEGRMAFFRSYLMTEGDRPDSEKESTTGPAFEQRENSDDGVESKAKHLYQEVERFLLAPRLLWCMWSMVQSTNDQIPFGYWKYAQDRMEDYQEHKKRLLEEQPEKEAAN